MKKVFYFVMTFLWVLGTLGGVCCSFYYEAYVIAVGCAACGWMAWPTMRSYAERLISE